jgi:hypothetical protein
MPREIISIENAEKIANYDKLKEELKQEKSKTDYWKNEHFQLSLKNKELRKTIKKLTEENDSLKEIISKVNRGNNEKR